jgi:flagellar hook-basal body complex protein FliE
MNIEFASAVRALDMQKLEAPVPSAKMAPAAGVPFGELLTQSVQALNTAQVQAGEQIQSFLSGQGPNIHTLMMDIEKANLSVEFGVQVRNKVMDAYNEIMHMQV